MLRSGWELSHSVRAVVSGSSWVVSQVHSLHVSEVTVMATTVSLHVWEQPSMISIGLSEEEEL